MYREPGVSWSKVINLGEFFNQMKAGSRPPKGLQVIRTLLDERIRQNLMPAFNRDGPESIAVHAVREHGSMGGLRPATGKMSLPEGFLMGAYVPVGYLMLLGDDLRVRGTRHFRAALKFTPDHEASFSQLLSINAAGHMPRIPEAYRLQTSGGVLMNSHLHSNPGFCAVAVRKSR